jgi:diadenosine tetraphosphate (Ap4A) HIT family hydrolase
LTDANVGIVKWPESFYELYRGEGCAMCAAGRPDEDEFGVRIFAGEVSDAYLQRDGRQRGYTIAIWRGRHVAEPTELTADEAVRYWLEVLQVGRAIETALQPVKMNYEVLGNSLPHLHTHVMPRYADDPRPGWPFPHPEERPPPHPDHELQRDVDALRVSLTA